MHYLPKRLDLNLLVVFEAVFRLRSVTAAAAELSMSNSALSHALTRLREALDDDLFVRRGNRMEPTIYASEIAASVGDALDGLSEGLMHAGEFLAEHSERTFVFSATDYTTFVVMPMLVPHLQQLSPRTKVKVVSPSQKLLVDEMAAGHVDFALVYSEAHRPLPDGLDRFDWLVDDYIVVASKTHPFVRDRLSLADYTRARHLIVTPWNEARGVVDYVLDKQNLQRTIALQITSVLAAPFIIESSDLLMTIPRRAAQRLGPSTNLATFEPPFAIPKYSLQVVSHAKQRRTRSHQWLLGEMRKLAAQR